MNKEVDILRSAVAEAIQRLEETAVLLDKEGYFSVARHLQYEVVAGLTQKLREAANAAV